jgi:hypothetical protein
MNKLILLPSLALSLAATTIAAQSVSPDASRFALSLDAGTTGIGGSVWITASDHFTLTLGYGALDLDEDYSTDEADYTGTAKLANGHAFLNWHPFRGGFHLRGGAILADDTFEAVAVPASGTTYTFNGVDYPASAVGNLSASVLVADDLVPYAGLGWSTSPRKKGFGMFIDAGVMFSGSVEATVAADGPLASDPTFQANLEQERQELQDELDEYKVFPVIRVGLMYRF